MFLICYGGCGCVGVKEGNVVFVGRFIFVGERKRNGGGWLVVGFL